MGKALCRTGCDVRTGRTRSRTFFNGLIRVVAGIGILAGSAEAQLPEAFDTGKDNIRLDASRFTVVAARSDQRLAASLLDHAQRNDTFPGLPRPKAKVLIAIAPDAARFRAWIGRYAPEWGAAVAFPDQQRIVMQGATAGSDAGDPVVVLRHELAHLALHEAMGHLPPRWFDEGYASYAAGEWNREQAFEASLSLVWRTLPGIDSLDAGFYAGAGEASWSYAVAHRVVSELASLDRERGLSNFFRYWRESGSFEVGLREAFGITSQQFDVHWKRQTRRRYGALALVTNVSVFVGILLVLLGPLVVKRRRRDRQRLEAMRAQEAAQEAAARASALDAMLRLQSTAEDQPTAASDGALPPSDRPPS
jgi:hypothetical protein